MAEADAFRASGGPLWDVEAFVCCVEEACRSSGPVPSEQDLGRLPGLRDACAARGAVGEELQRLRSLAYRLWRACAAPGCEALAGLAEARLRQFACELHAACRPSASGSAEMAGLAAAAQLPFLAPAEGGRDEEATLAAQWALAGRAWAAAGRADSAIRCFEAAAQAWEAAAPDAAALGSPGVTKLAEAAMQAHVWASAVHFGTQSHSLSMAALARAKDALSFCSPGEGVLEDFLRTCCQQASEVQSAGRPQQAIELLTLALATVPAEEAEDGSRRQGSAAAAMRARLLRHLALCYGRLPERGRALEHARAAVQEEDPASSASVLSLRILLQALCELPPPPAAASAAPGQGTDAGADGSADGGVGAGQEEPQAVAMTIARHAAASVDDGLWACGLLRGAGHPAARVLACLKELRARVRSADAESQRKLLLYRLEFASAVVESGSSSPGLPSGDDAWVLLQEVVLELREVAQRAEQAWLELFREVVALLWSKSSAAFEAGDHAKAAQWLTQAVPFIQEPGQVANCLATIALYHKRAGNKEDTRDYVQRALATDPANLQATLLVVVDSADHAVEAAHIQGLLERLMANPSFAPKHAACVASALLQQPQADLALAGLEVLLRKLLQAPAEAANLEQTAGADVLDGLSISCEVLERSAALKRPAADFVRHVGLSADHLLAHRAEVIQAFREGSGPRVDEVRRLLRAAWERGKELGASEHWEECAAVLEALQGLLEQLDALDSREVLEVRIWGLVMAASAKLSLARGAARGPKARSETHQQALHCLDRAHQLCRRASSAAGAIAGQAAASALLGASTLGRAFCVLVLLEFEVRCLSGDSESQLQRFVDDASSQEAVGIKALLFMAKIAAASSMRKLAMHCLQRYLRVAVNASGGLDAPQCAVAYRELIGLHASRQESFVVYDGILNLLSGVGGMSGVIDGAVVKYPKDELEWLAATAWNNGAYFYRLQQYRWAERWMSKSMALLKFIPGSFPEDDMVKSYTDCVEHCRD